MSSATERIPLSSIPRISVEEAHRRFVDRSAVFVDVRRASDFEEVHVLGAFSTPMYSQREKLFQLPRDRTLVLYCA